MTDLPLLPLPDDDAGLRLPEGTAFSQLPTPADIPDSQIIPQNTLIPLSEEELAVPFHFTFAGRECTSPADLAQAMVDAWDEARLGLLTGRLAEALDAVSLPAASVCREATAAAAAGTITADRAVLSVIHRLSGKALVVWQGRRYASAIDLGSSLLQALRGTGAIPAHFDSLMTSAAASVFAEEAQKPGLRRLESRCAAPDCTLREKTCLMYMVGFLLCGTAALVMEGETFYTVEQLAAWLEGRARRSSAAFTRACHRLLDADHLLDPQLEAWLIALGRRQDVALWQAEMDAGML